MKTNKIIAHRGAFNNSDVPENSLKAFQKAMDLGYAIELDVQLTKDNVLIVFHDDNLERMTGLNQLVSNTFYSEIKELFLLDTKEKIPTFQEVLNLILEKVFLDIEIKPTKKKKEVCDLLLNELKDYHHYSLKSFQPAIVKYLKKQNLSVEVGYLIDYHYSNVFYQTILPSKYLIHYLKPDFLSIHKKLLLNKKFQKILHNYPYSIWTIKEKDLKDYFQCTLICNDLLTKK